MNAKLFSEAITEVDNKYYEEAATYDYRVDNDGRSLSENQR